MSTMGGYQLRALSGEPGDSKGDRGGEVALVQLCAADGESRFPERAPRDGAGAIQLVSSLRPQSTEFCAEHFLGEASAVVS